MDILPRFEQAFETLSHNYLFATAATQWLGVAVYDTQCGAKLFRVTDRTRRLFESPFSSRWLFDIEILRRFLQQEGGLRIVEYPLEKWTDVRGSKITPLTYLQPLRDFLRIAIRYRNGKE